LLSIAIASPLVNGNVYMRSHATTVLVSRDAGRVGVGLPMDCVIEAVVSGIVGGGAGERRR